MGGLTSKNNDMNLLTAEQIRQKLDRYAERNCLKMASIGSGYKECPIPNIGGRTLYKAYKGKKISDGKLAILELFFMNLEKENND